MVDERLQAQEARRLGTTASDNELKDAIAKIETQNGWEKNTFDSRVAGAGLDRNVITEQIRTEIAWGKMVRRRFASTVTVSEEEIDSAAASIEANRGRPENRVAEIFLPVDDPDQDAVVRGAAEDLVEQLRTGGSFAAVARQFSKGVTSGQGGEIGWVVAGQLAAEVEREVAALSPGQVSAPIHTFDGYYIVTVIERRLALSGTAGDPTFRLAQVVLDSTSGNGPTTQTLINDLRATRDCASFLAAASGRTSPISGELGTIALSDMPDDLRTAIQSLQTGQTTPPLAYEGARRVIMVCDRSEPDIAAQSVDREAIRRELGTRKLELAGRRYLRDLRRAAFVDIRV
jgi:peptidyl-prolyl cis-trans isomerase SurA